MSPDHQAHGVHSGHGSPAPSGPSAPPGPSPTTGVSRGHEAEPAAPGMMMEHGGGAVWPHFANMTVDLWLITSAFALGLESPGLQVSDVVSGTLVA